MTMPTPVSVNNSTANKQCVIVGHSIDAITTATVMVSLGNKVSLYADQQQLEHTLANYEFEHQQQALWQLYVSQNSIVISELPQQASAVFAEAQASLYWLFYSDLSVDWQQKNGEQPAWISDLNESQLSTQTPVILSGISTLGVFADLAEQCRRPWVYYVPFVFLQDGRAYPSMLSPKLWLMGEKTADSVDKVAMIQPLMAQAQNSYVSDIATIEFSRSAIMSMLATRVSFMNEWSRLADQQGVDILQVADIMGLDSRIGSSYLKAGWGFGGQTLPTEIEALHQTLQDTQVDHRLMQAVNVINDDQKELIFRKFWQYFDGAIEQKQVTVWGASYKSGSGRTSSAAIHPLLRLLWSYNITTYVYALEAQAELASLYPQQPLLKFISEPTQPLANSDALFVLSWPDTKRLPISAINEVVLPVFDAQNAFSREHIQSLVGGYQGIGRRKD
ncbi:UDP-glucose/GDP-mannose dehydrogenase family protein [Psychrobacter sp. FDAARGOS_221]|uniref:UDP-glucose/GDP-mannose dehydrogenase family protein n=1 Tax=Psychrobacter sp. FDAARGOS_221 TaxID=1975705 RepID=UPI000BB59822|nr:UDP-glucose/GDP-mannose dehydrogenase family protein [Psychrobacter sp. FDAARGOS_221]PNK60484.1 UDP-glucose/GDP-mannose dehydrogenase family protein [Psychrobacter sp. FDAARGOS_221]